jgi:hypothetical protein
MCIPVGFSPTFFACGSKLGNASDTLDFSKRIRQNKIVDVAIADPVVTPIHANFRIGRARLASGEEISHEFLGFTTCHGAAERIGHGDERAVEVHLQEAFVALRGIDDDAELVGRAEGYFFGPDRFALEFGPDRRVRVGAGLLDDL